MFTLGVNIRKTLKSNNHAVYRLFYSNTPLYLIGALPLPHSVWLTPVATLHKESPPEGGELDPRLRGRCPLARLRLASPTFATWQGGRTGGLRPTYLPPMPKRVVVAAASRVRLRPRTHPFGARASPCAPRAASVRALDTASTQQQEPNGKGVK